MIIDGWLDWAERRDGHPQKVYSQPNAGTGIACHSIVGDLPNHSIPTRFLSDDRVPGQPGRFTDAASASVMFILYRDGHLVQMYPVTASTWTSGGFEGNTRFWAIEAEGGWNPTTEPLTREAGATFIRLVTEWEAYSGFTAAPNVNILQHKQIASMFGYAATACASDRYANIWARIAAGERYGDDMTPEEREEHAALVAIMGGRAKLLDNAARGNDFILGYSLEQEKLAKHLNNHDQGGGETEHSHSQYVLKDALREVVE